MISMSQADSMNLRGRLKQGAGALVIAHPGHELRVHGWLEQAQPIVFVLTDGSGRSGRPRLDSTTQLLRRVGAAPGSLYGRFSDGAVYAALVNGDIPFFLRIVGELTQAFLQKEIAYAVADAAEGFNPSHDVCRLLVDAAAARAGGVRGWPLTCFDFPLVEPPDVCPEELRTEAVVFRLDDAALARKLSAARTYHGLEAEVEEAMTGLGTEAFRHECLRPARPWPTDGKLIPFYERHGQERVTAGQYRQVLRYRDHVRPLAEAFRPMPERAP
jgi:hypothetical protein